MRLLSLTLDSFRSYPALRLDFDPSETVTVLLGENATGKTNILEAISVLALLKSPRKAGDGDLMNWGNAHYRIRGACRSDLGEEKTLEVVSQREPRTARAFLVNGVRTPARRYIGTLPIVTFGPEDLTLFTGSPPHRRHVVDELLSQVSPSYLQASAEYEKSLRQRNTLLRRVREGMEKPRVLDVWDEKLAVLGAVLVSDRLQLFETLRMTILRELRSLGEKPQSAEFHYMRRGTATEESAIRQELLSRLHCERERDIQTLITTTGPHRDDWTLSLDGRNIVSFASRGQHRSAVLALLLLEASFLELRTGERPVLLLDDVFSEFDGAHRAAVFKTLSRHQVLVTAVELDGDLRKNARVVACPLNA